MAIQSMSKMKIRTKASLALRGVLIRYRCTLTGERLAVKGIFDRAESFFTAETQRRGGLTTRRARTWVLAE
jgi:hypothetical protein